MRPLFATADMGPVPGGTQPKRFVDCNGLLYVAKRSADPNGEHHNGKKTKERFNELLASALARRLDICVPDFAIVQIPDGLVDGFAQGSYFCSRFMSDYKPLPDGSRITAAITNYDIAAVYLLFAFDVLLLNPDRKAGDVLQPNKISSTPARLVAIDHANILTGSHWWQEHLSNNYLDLPGYTAGWLFKGLNDTDSATRAADQIKDAAHDFTSALGEVADSSEISSEEQRVVAELLKIRLQHLQELVLKALNIAALPAIR